MSMWIMHTLNGISFGMLLFLLASGLTLILGLMSITNLSHGGYYLLGAYIGVTVMMRTGNFFLAMLVSGISIAIIGILMERFFLRGLHLQPLPQVLLTIGFTFVFADIALMMWGGEARVIEKPAFLANPVFIGKIGFPSYRLFVILVGAAVGLLLWWLQERTRVGAMVRAAVNDEEVARGLGINVPLLFTLVFGLGAFLAGLCGVLGGPFIGVYPGADFEILLLTLIVIIVGGVGSLKGALMGSLLIGLIDNFGKVLFPELARFTIYAPMVIILALKPSGLFGSRN
jgi:branched-chain amino acid transport system permease protein